MQQRSPPSIKFTNAFDVVLGVALVGLIAGGCRDRSAAPASAVTEPKFSKGVVGVWVVRMEPTLQRTTAIPHEVSSQFTDLAAYKASLRERLEGLQFEFYPDNKVFLRFSDGKSPFVSGNTVWRFNWERREDASYRLIEPGPYVPLLTQSVSHHFEMTDNDSALCRYQAQWSENSAPRTPLVLEKTWE